MTNDAEHPFVCLLAIYIFSLATCQFRIYLFFKIGLCTILLTSGKSSLCFGYKFFIRYMIEHMGFFYLPHTSAREYGKGKGQLIGIRINV